MRFTINSEEFHKKFVFFVKKSGGQIWLESEKSIDRPICENGTLAGNGLKTIHISNVLCVYGGREDFITKCRDWYSDYKNTRSF